MEKEIYPFAFVDTHSRGTVVGAGRSWCCYDLILIYEVEKVRRERKMVGDREAQRRTNEAENHVARFDVVLRFFRHDCFEEEKDFSG